MIDLRMRWCEILVSKVMHSRDSSANESFVILNDLVKPSRTELEVYYVIGGNKTKYLEGDFGGETVQRHLIQGEPFRVTGNKSLTLISSCEKVCVKSKIAKPFQKSSWLWPTI